MLNSSRMLQQLLLIIFSFFLSLVNCVPKLDYHPEEHETYHYYAVQISHPFLPDQQLTRHDIDNVHRIARLVERDLHAPHDMAVDLVGQIGELDGHYLFRVPKTAQSLSDAHLERFQGHPSVLWVYQQEPKRLKRKRSEESNRDAIFSQLNIHDPGVTQQWHLFNAKNRQADTNVTGAWLRNVTGEGVVVAVIDDGRLKVLFNVIDSLSLGIAIDHDDIKPNFFEPGSYDFNEKTKLPLARNAEDYHGTRCAGEIAAAVNSACGVGVAYNAKVSGIRILGAPVTDVDEALAVNYGYQQNHIYSCSWGPEDDGRHVEGPNQLVTNAIINGIKKGRQGLGSIFVFATGNGGFFEDNCNYDGYTNSLYTISIGAVDWQNQHPAYSEQCSAHLAVTYSSGSGNYIYTTDVHGCAGYHGGTSAAAPVAAGILALLLSVRPDLSWRDVQHLTIRAAVPITLDDPDWQKTVAGRMYSHKFAYGTLDSSRIVDLAKDWKNVGPQTSLKTDVKVAGKQIPFGSDGLNSTIVVTEKQVGRVGLQRLEHVTITVTITHQCRGDLDIWLVSPSNIISYIGPRRNVDKSKDGFSNWTFMSVKHWEEPPAGEWTLIIKDNYNEHLSGKLENWYLTLWGEANGNFTSTNNSTTNTSPSDSSEPSVSFFSPPILYGIFLLCAGALLTFCTVRVCQRWKRKKMIPGRRVTGYAIVDDMELEDAFAAEERNSPISRLRTPLQYRSPGQLSGVDMATVYALDDES